MEFMDLMNPVLRISIVLLPSCVTLHPVHQVEKLATFLDTVRLHPVYLSFCGNINNFGYYFCFFGFSGSHILIEWLKKWKDDKKYSRNSAWTELMQQKNYLPFQTQNHEVSKKHRPHAPCGTICLRPLFSDQEVLFCIELLSALSESHDLS